MAKTAWQFNMTEIIWPLFKQRKGCPMKYLLGKTCGLSGLGIGHLQSCTFFPLPGKLLSICLLQHTGPVTGPFHDQVQNNNRMADVSI